MTGTMKRWLRLACVASAFAATGALMMDQADARSGRGGSIGSRGTKTYQPPATTPTAPSQAKPIERSMTQPGNPAATATRNTGVQPAAQASRSGSMMRNLLLGGLIGAGLATMFGAGALANVLGFVLQMLLFGGLIYLAFAFFRSRSQSTQPAPAMAGTGPNVARVDQALNRSATSAPGGSSPVLNLQQADFDAFERLLADIQLAYGRADLNALGDRVTPEMLSYFARDLDEDAKRGVRNELGQPKLLQGDLSESWRDPSGEWATVAMRYALTDATVEIATGRVVDGSRTEPQEVTEIWTFRRRHSTGPDAWELSAIQQA